ncbi:MAG: hypothetical protein NC355_10170 [Blautia sp.]|nr:hypothetical protein [Blautia sp.]
MESAIAGHGCPVKPALSYDGELRVVASGETSFTEGLENPFTGADSVEPLRTRSHSQFPKVDFQEKFSGPLYNF